MPTTEQVFVQPAAAGNVSIAPPTFLERWGVVFVACIGGWILVVGSGILIYFLRYQPPLPDMGRLTPDQAGTRLPLTSRSAINGETRSTPSSICW